MQVIGNKTCNYEGSFKRNTKRGSRAEFVALIQVEVFVGLVEFEVIVFLLAILVLPVHVVRLVLKRDILRPEDPIKLLVFFDIGFTCSTRTTNSLVGRLMGCYLPAVQDAIAPLLGLFGSRR